MLLSTPSKQEEPLAELACSMPSKMRDACGNKIAVYVFHCAFQNFSGLPCHVVGIQEDSLEERLAPLATAQSRQNKHSSETSEHHQSLREVGDTDAQCQDSVSLASSTLSFEADLGRTFVWVDANTRQLTVLRCNMSFTTLCGPTGNCVELIPWISKRQRYDFTCWVQGVSNMLMHAEDEQPELEPFKHLILYPHHLVRHKVWLRADVHVLPESGQDEDEWSILQLELCKIQWFRGRGATGQMGDQCSRCNSGGSVILEQAVLDVGVPRVVRSVVGL